MEWDMEVPYAFETITSEALGIVRTRRVKRYDRLNATLIVVSSSILKQWEQELERTPLRVHSVVNSKSLDTLNVDDFDVVLVLPKMYNRLVSSTELNAWKRFVFDEPGHVRIPGMKAVTAGFYWFITATPNDITVYHRNCRGSFIRDILGDGWHDFETMFGSMIVKNDPEFVHSSFHMPPTIHSYYECFNPMLNTVNGFVSSAITTMIDAGNIGGAIAALGGGRTKNLVELVKQKKQEELEEIEAKVRIYRIRMDEARLKDWASRASHVVNQLAELDKRFDDMMRLPCNICLDQMTSPVMEPDCQNVFCGECLLKWLVAHQSCPMCRATVDTSSLVYIERETENDYPMDICPGISPTKLSRTIEIINDKPEGRFLVFSEYDDTFKPICNSLADNKIEFVQIKGGLKSRQKGLDDFKTGKARVIFLNSGYNSAGVNLQEATDIILYHEMPLTTQTQIVGRANRIGRKSKLHVHHLQVQA